MDEKFRLSQQIGFTLLEMLVTVSITAILLAVGVPSYVTFIDNNRVTSQANDLLYSFNMARSEAIKRGAEVRLVSVAGSDWSDGWNLVADTNNDSDFDDAADILMQWEALNGDGSLAIAATNSPSNTYMAFTSRGGLSPSNASFIFTLEPGDCDAIDSRIIALEPGGRASISHGDCSE
ncbi:GspH/FimT family pseudopilin [Porticoccaceae bacterium]|nr:GspH/FimT family pseudopilin [Porticoccaceae bacterium]MDC1453262.1 GspH/FimT family pseudopilin [Porticoccaceae bacterium]